MIPIYHIHGVCNIPDSIVITNEDYAYMFRPNDYRQARLPFLMKESLVIMIGYALGDLNVITAVVGLIMFIQIQVENTTSLLFSCFIQIILNKILS